MRQWLHDARKKKQLSQSQVAKQVGISQPAYCDIENSNRNPHPDTAKKIAEVLGFNWTRFFE